MKVGCPGSDLALGPDICVRFVTSSCTQGCSRYRAMELCELSGGFLVELEEEQQLQDLLRATAGTEHGRTFWWTSGMDIRSVHSTTRSPLSLSVLNIEILQ